jgi:hypothetical protein
MPFQAWHAAAFLGVVLTMLAVALRRRADKARKFEISHPHHLSELAQAIDLVSKAPRREAAIESRNGDQEGPVVTCTTLGIQISGGKIQTETTVIDHYAFSCRGGTMNREAAATLASLILRLRRAPASQELVGGDQGVFHLLLRSAGETELVQR